MRLPPSLRQLIHPREFRIAAPEWPRELAALIESLQPLVDSDGSAATAASPDPGSLVFLAEVGTGLWRLRQKMLQPGTDRPLEEMRRVYRHLESTWDALTEAGVQIQDHTDEPFHFGRSIKVISYQPTMGITREKVLETIRPTVYFRGTPIQMGEVIVGIPEPPSESAERLSRQ
ncbi:MAG: hypothetical protein JSU08_15525 [Acidobacteria bacterium]|nr:hypothetical protein [Acidobacteriota bacterium]